MIADIGDVHRPELGRQNRPFVHTADYGACWAYCVEKVAPDD